MRASLARVASLLVALAPLLIAALVSVANASRGNPLGSFAEEYSGGGSCKLRVDAAFEALLLFAFAGFPLGAWAIWRGVRSRQRGLAVVAGVGLVALVATGFVRPALGICP